MNLLGLQSKLESQRRYVPFTVEMVGVGGGSDRVDAHSPGGAAAGRGCIFLHSPAHSWGESSSLLPLHSYPEASP